MTSTARSGTQFKYPSAAGVSGVVVEELYEGALDSRYSRGIPAATTRRVPHGPLASISPAPLLAQLRFFLSFFRGRVAGCVPYNNSPLFTT